MCIRYLAAAAILLVGCTRASPTPEQTAARMKVEADAARPAVAAQNARLVSFVAAAQADSFASVYTEDAVLYPLNSPAVRGRDAIASMVRAGFAAGSFTYAPTTLSLEVSDPIAIETGQTIITFDPRPEAPAEVDASVDTIIYVAVWRKVDGQWLISKDIGTSDRPTQPTLDKGN